MSDEISDVNEAFGLMFNIYCDAKGLIRGLAQTTD